MKRINSNLRKLCVGFILVFSLMVSAQNTIVIQPDALDGQDAPVFQRSPSTNYGTSNDQISFAWTFSGTPFLGKSYIKFDLSQVPSNAIITNAQLSLYHNSSSSSSAGQAGTNSCELKEVTSNWAESTVTWNSQPTTSNIGAVTIPTSTSATQDYTNIDITAFAQDWHSNPANNFEMEMDIINKTPLASMKFCSSDYSVASKRPKITITYTLSNQNCVILRPNGTSGKDALIFERDPTTNRGTSPDFISFAWTFSGTTYIGQSLLEFDLSQIPANATITDAKLSLYHNPTSGSAGQAGANASQLRKITSSWDEATVTWSNKPTTSSSGAVSIAASNSATEDYENIDLTAMAQNWHTNSSTNYGVMLNIDTRTPLASMLFCSSDHLDSTKRPKFVVCYTLDSTNSITQNSTTSRISVYPNPASNILNFDTRDMQYNDLNIFNCTGKLVIKTATNIGINSIDISALSSGIYQYTLQGKSRNETGKIVITK